MKKTDQIFKLSISLGILVTALAVGYYFAIYIPNYNFKKIQIEQLKEQQKEIKEVQKDVEKEQEEARILSIKQECRKDAYKQAWADFQEKIKSTAKAIDTTYEAIISEYPEFQTSYDKGTYPIRYKDCLLKNGID